MDLQIDVDTDSADKFETQVIGSGDIQIYILSYEYIELNMCCFSVFLL